MPGDDESGFLTRPVSPQWPGGVHGHCDSEGEAGRASTHPAGAGKRLAWRETQKITRRLLETAWSLPKPWDPHSPTHPPTHHRQYWFSLLSAFIKQRQSIWSETLHQPSSICISWSIVCALGYNCRCGTVPFFILCKIGCLQTLHIKAVILIHIRK